MQNVIIEKPYRFAAPYTGRLWPKVLGWVAGGYLNRRYGVAGVEIEGMERLAASAGAGHGIVLAPNHCRDCDPVVMGVLSHRIGLPFHHMASWHLFAESRFWHFMLRRAGAFSVWREGLDRSAISAAVEIVAGAQRPLVIFPEGVISRTNDRLNALMDGVSLIARTAAKRRVKAGGRTVVHPVAIRYRFEGDVHQALTPVLERLEMRLSWRPQKHLSLVERTRKLGLALLCMKEAELLGDAQEGAVAMRLPRLIDHLLCPLETEWIDGPTEGTVVARVKRLRAAIVPGLIGGTLGAPERQHRWMQLADLDLAQQLWHYPPAYIAHDPTPMRLIETVERFEEDLTGAATVHRPFRANVTIGAAIEVAGQREKSGESDELTLRIDRELSALLGIGESPVMHASAA